MAALDGIDRGPVAAAGRTSTDWRAVLLLSLGFGLVGLDRFMILPMFPIIAGPLSLRTSDLGLITGILAISWGCSAALCGHLADRFGRRRVVVWAMVLFSLLVGISGLAEGMASLMLLRAMMGFAEGAYVTPGIGATNESAAPRHRGVALGLQQLAIGLFGLALAPIFVTRMAAVIDWRWIFGLVGLPGLVVAGLLHCVLRDTGSPSETSVRHRRHWAELLRYPNLWLAMVIMVAGLTALVVISALLPSYLITVLHYDLATMGWVLSGGGFGSVLGAVVMLTLSDRIGRRAATIIAAVGVTLSLLLLERVGQSPAMISAELFGVSFFSIALVALADGPIAVEAVPFALAASSSGLVIAAGEILGGGFAPILVGWLANERGLQIIFPVTIAASVIGLAASLFLRLKAPPPRSC